MTDEQPGFERDRNDLRNFAMSIANSSRLPGLRLVASRCSLLVNQLLGQDRRSSTDASPSLASSSIATPSDITLPSPAASAPLSALEPLYGLQVCTASPSRHVSRLTDTSRFCSFSNFPFLTSQTIFNLDRRHSLPSILLWMPMYHKSTLPLYRICLHARSLLRIDLFSVFALL